VAGEVSGVAVGVGGGATEGGVASDVPVAAEQVTLSGSQHTEIPVLRRRKPEHKCTDVACGIVGVATTTTGGSLRVARGHHGGTALGDGDDGELLAAEGDDVLQPTQHITSLTLITVQLETQTTTPSSKLNIAGRKTTQGRCI
jgi:hypothetical protein